MEVIRRNENPVPPRGSIGVSWRRGAGIFLPEAALWLDSRRGRAREWAFVSHAHADHVARHQRLICSPATAELMRRRFGGGEVPECLTPDWDQPVDIDGFTARLLPAGHIPGSAMLHLTRQSDGASLLYTGDFKLRGALAHEPCRPRPATTLILETTFALPSYRFPPEPEIAEQLRRLAREAIEEGEIPVLLGYSLGKAQAILTALTGSGLPIMLHESVHEMTVCCQQLGMAFPPFRPFKADGAAGHVLVFPPSAARSTTLRRLKPTRMVMLSGWALTPGARFRYQVDEVLPLSDHADHPELLRMVELVNPREVWTVHGYAAEFAAELRRAGRDAWSLISANQLELNLETAAGHPDRREHDPDSAPVESAHDPDHPANTAPDRFATLARVLDLVAASGSRLRKLELLADHLRQLDDGALEQTGLWLTGRTLGRRDPTRTLQIGWAVIRRALIASTGLTEAVYREVSRSQNDAGRTAHLMLARRQPRPAGAPLHASWTVHSLHKRLLELRDLAGPAAKTDALADTLAGMSPGEGSLLVRLLTGDLRIGLKEGLAEEAVASACDAPAEAVREAHMLVGHLGQVAVLARHRRLDEVGARPGQPISSMLASPEADADAIWQRLVPAPPATPVLPSDPPAAPRSAGGQTGGQAGADGPAVWLEAKLDGIRAQLHRTGGQVHLFSRDQRSIAAEFPELIAAAGHLPADVILDGEIIARSRDHRTRTFFDLQRRLGRDRRAIADLFEEDVPVALVVFDLLWLNGESLLQHPLHARRRQLEALGLPPRSMPTDEADEARQAPVPPPATATVAALPAPIEYLPVCFADSAAAIENAFHAARRAGDEGLIAKDPASSYRPGRRGKSWLKLKKPFSTLDVVVVKAQQGHGRRAHLLSDYTFAVRDEHGSTGSNHELRVIGKAYSGLTETEIESLTEHFTRQTLSQRGRVRTVIPDTVLEVAFDSIQPSKRHNSGLALRFPRIIAIRHDKDIHQIDTLQHARRLAGLATGEDTTPVNRTLD